MNTSRPLVSIGIPFFNPGSYIIETAESVYNQSYQKIELIFYNDGSTDASADLVRSWIRDREHRFVHVFFINETVNRGVGYACDVLLKKSSGTYFQMLGADDLIYPDKIAHQVNILENRPEYSMVFGNLDRIKEDGTKFSEDYFTHQKFSTFISSGTPFGNIFPELIQENFIPASSVLVRKSIIEESGGYDRNLKSEDWDLWLRIAKNYSIYAETQCVGAYRILPTSAMHSSKNKIFVLESLNAALVKHKGISKKTDAIINEHLYKNTMEMYRLGHISKTWTRQLFKYKGGFKPWVYQLFMTLGIKINQKKIK